MLKTSPPWLLSFSALVTVLANEYPTQTRCVLSERAQLYLAPSDRMAWPTPRYTPLRHVDTNADWHLVEDFEGDRFWVHNQYVTDNGFLICGVLRRWPQPTADQGQIMNWWERCLP